MNPYRLELNSKSVNELENIFFGIFNVKVYHSGIWSKESIINSIIHKENECKLTIQGQTVSFGPHTVEFGGPDLQEMKGIDTRYNDKFVDLAKLALERDGYALLRGLLDREHVLTARRRVLDHMLSLERVLDLDKAPLESGVLKSRCGTDCVPFMEGKNGLTHNREVLQVLESPRLRNFFHSLFGEEAKTFDFKWLRAVPSKVYTGVHVDWVYMGRGSKRIMTTWIPLGDNPISMGALAMLEGSHRLPAFEKFRQTYGQLDIERDRLSGTGWYTMDPLELSAMGGKWKTTNYRAGDVIVFGMHTAHCSTTNITNFARISCDVRWLPRSGVSDPRYVGDVDVSKRVKAGLNSADTNDLVEDKVTIAQLKEKWAKIKI